MGCGLILHPPRQIMSLHVYQLQRSQAKHLQLLGEHQAVAHQTCQVWAFHKVKCCRVIQSRNKVKLTKTRRSPRNHPTRQHRRNSMPRLPTRKHAKYLTISPGRLESKRHSERPQSECCKRWSNKQRRLHRQKPKKQLRGLGERQKRNNF